jgi:hypothetical protein
MSDDNTPDTGFDGYESDGRASETTRRGILVLLLAAVSAAVIWLLDVVIPGGFETDGYGTGEYGSGGFGE